MALARTKQNAFDRHACARVLSAITFLPPFFLAQMGAGTYAFIFTGVIVALATILVLFSSKRVDIGKLGSLSAASLAVIYYFIGFYMVLQRMETSNLFAYAAAGIVLGYWCFVGLLKIFCRQSPPKKSNRSPDRAL